MKEIAVIGAGRIGSAIADLLSLSGDYAVTLIDRDQATLDRAEASSSDGAPVTRLAVRLGAGDGLAGLLEGKFALLSAAPFQLTTHIASAAVAAGVHYLDLTEDVLSTRTVRALAMHAESALIPQCGLAPGFVSIAAHDIASRFDSLDAIRLRVGALPRYPDNALGYNLTWSTDGVINEYIQPCEAIVQGERHLVPALEECERLIVDGVAYEAFNTSGGLGSLCETYAGRVRELNYRTMRYPGHAAVMKLLLQDLRLAERRDVLRDILEHALPTTAQDLVVVFVTVTGTRGGHFVQETLARTVLAGPVGGRHRTAIQLTTAGSICAVLDLLAQGRLPTAGFVRQEDIPLDAFLENRFGRVYAGQPILPDR
ncbi:saccharopine dehydrogenase family protein [Lichenicoccus roseus]|uniref:Saccharopine dehydrogenase family protein n=1 Tax=Lichenicoccus roseus TaxID=2683649 RepID=A0A5R9J177_9PROT|nr:saccharopine dehydrogenase C-terminal domain-containing protein [Lichenicoccus roseus]TLU70603.1 saccharopine dehydrogenase family protein [Lichenicoccus roseus]